MKYLPYGLFGGVAALMIVLFALALPDATVRAGVGNRRATEAACEGLQPAPSNPAFASFPTPAPDFKLKNFQGQEISLSSFRGHVVLVNFWATWCGTCVVEMPSMEKLVEKEQGKPFRLLAVSVDDGWDPIRKFFASGTKLDILLDTSREIPKRWGTEKFPESYLIDRDGNIRYFVISDRDWSQPSVGACIDALIDS